MGRPLLIRAAPAGLLVVLSAVASIVACTSFTAESSSDGGVVQADASSTDSVDATSAPDVGEPDGLPPASVACAKIVCPNTTPSVCETFDVTPGGAWKREPSDDVGSFFFPTVGCGGGGGLRVNGAAAMDLTSDLFFIEVGTTKATRVRVAFDVYYELTGTFDSNNAYIDFLMLSTAPRSARAGTAALALADLDGTGVATVFQSGQPTASEAFFMPPKQWHRVTASTTFGTGARLEVSVDGAPSVVVQSGLEVSGNPSIGAAVGFGRWSDGVVPGVSIAFDNITVRVD